MAEQIDHECPQCGHENYKIVDSLSEYLGTSGSVDEPTPDDCKRLPVGCQRHGCDELYYLYLRP